MKGWLVLVLNVALFGVLFIYYQPPGPTLAHACRQSARFGISQVVVCQARLDADSYRAMGSEICEWSESLRCVVDFWHGEANVPRSFPMTETQIKTKDAVWYAHNKQLMLCNQGVCTGAP